MRIILLFSFFALLSLSCCKKDEPTEGIFNVDLTDIPYDAKPYDLQISDCLPNMPIPMDNPMTENGVQLGRMLFYDPILSADSTQSCSSCHLPTGNFTDNLAVSTGIDGIAGKRSSMPLLDVGFATFGLFWDGRAQTLEEQALLPVEDPIELHNTWENALDKIVRTERYQEGFRKAFGLSNTNQITKELAAKAIAQFERTIVSTANTKYDLFIKTQDPDVFTEQEFEGYLMFFDIENNLATDAECAHCHAPPLFTSNEFNNNGLQEAATVDDFKDKGLGGITGKSVDMGAMKIPTLRNIALSAPYMHDGRFQTLEEVIEHYNSGGHPSPTKDPLIRPLGLLGQGFMQAQKDALIAFLHTLTDTVVINRPDLQNPFE